MASEKKYKKQDSWIDEVMEIQEVDLEQEEQILSTVPQRIRYKVIRDDE